MKDWRQFFDRVTFGTALVLIVISALSVLFVGYTYPGTAYLAYVFDDFFYYAQVARNIYETGASTFDGKTLTNGYQPLWMAVLVGLMALVGGEDRAFLFAVSTVIFLCVVGVFFLAYALARRLVGERALASLLALQAAGFTLFLARTGVEVGLLLFVLFLWVNRLMAESNDWDRTTGGYALGFFTSLLVLCRLDVALLVALFLIPYSLSAGSIRASAIRLGKFCAGGILLPLYLASNVSFFDTLLPISGMVKHLDLSWRPSFVFLDMFTAPILVNPVYVWPSLALGGAAILMLLVARSTIQDRHRKIVWPVLLFPWAFFVTWAFWSNWTIWEWYFYPLVPSLTVAGAMLWRLLRRCRVVAEGPSRAMVVFAPLVLVVVVLTIGALWRRPIEPTDPAMFMYHQAVRIRDFARTHPGTYAMGDRGGVVGYMLGQPMVQTEGLVMDRAFLEHIRNQDDLISVLREHDVDYYVTVRARPDSVRGGFSVTEPCLSGSLSPRMRGHFSEAPVHAFSVPCPWGESSVSIFRLRGEQVEAGAPVEEFQGGHPEQPK